jgi:hypothetical protein
MQTIVNAAPLTVFRGIQDQSTVSQVVEAEVRPAHLPKIYLYTKSGPTTPVLADSAYRDKIFGSDSFDLRKPWATHQTVLSNIVTSQGNVSMIQRVKPADAGPNSNIRLYLDILPMTVPLYERNSDGSYVLDDDGLKVATGETVSGFKAKWVVGNFTVTSGTPDFGTGTIKTGDQTAQSTQSQRYPIMDLEVPFFGADGNNKGVRLWTNSVNSSTPLDTRLLADAKVYPFRMACISRTDSLSTPEIQESLFAEQNVELSLKPATLDRNTDTMIYVGDRFLQQYQDFDTRGVPPTYGPFGRVHVYDANVKTLLDMVYAAELAVGESADFQGVAGEEYLFNLFNGFDSNGRPYDSYLINNVDANAVRLAEGANIYATGGSDGTMSEALFAGLVATQVAEYANPNSPLMDSVNNPESIIYDSGFPLETKYELMKVLSIRKDIACVIGTHDVLGNELTASQEYSLAISLRTRMQNYPESEYFGTSTCRGMIVGRSGRLLSSNYTKRLPLTLEVAMKASRYMGAGNGNWKPGFSFSKSPENQVTLFTDINVLFTPASTRNKEWAAGLVTVQNFQRGTAFFPAFKTVYDKDDSVLNSFITMMACVELQKVGELLWREFSGRDDLTNSQLKERIQKRFDELVQGKFDDRFVIAAEVYYTAADQARGYSWTTKITIQAANMKTVQTLELAARRLPDSTQNQ